GPDPLPPHGQHGAAGPGHLRRHHRPCRARQGWAAAALAVTGPPSTAAGRAGGCGGKLIVEIMVLSDYSAPAHTCEERGRRCRTIRSRATSRAWMISTSTDGTTPTGTACSPTTTPTTCWWTGRVRHRLAESSSTSMP